MGCLLVISCGMLEGFVGHSRPLSRRAATKSFLQKLHNPLKEKNKSQGFSNQPRFPYESGRAFPHDNGRRQLQSTNSTGYRQALW